MKKLKLLLSLSILFFALYSCSEQLEVQDVESIDFRGQPTKSGEFGPNNVTDLDCGISCPLIAGQSIDAGTVTVTNDDENLYVTVFSTYGFQQVDENIKMSIGDIAELPSKRPPAGHFDYKWTEVNGDGTPNTHTFTIALEGLEFWDGKGNCKSAETSTPFYIILHADVLTKSGSSETAFGGCIDPDTKGAWWYYMEYAVSCCEEEEELLNAFGVKHNNTQSSCASDVWKSWVFGGWLNGYTEENPFKGMVLYLEDNDNCDNFDNQIVGHIEINIMDNDVNTLKIKYVITDDHYALSGIDFSIKERDIDTDYRNFKEPVDMESEYTLYIPWSGNINHNEQLLYFIQQAKVVMK